MDSVGSRDNVERAPKTHGGRSGALYPPKVPSDPEVLPFRRGSLEDRSVTLTRDVTGTDGQDDGKHQCKGIAESVGDDLMVDTEHR